MYRHKIKTNQTTRTLAKKGKTDKINKQIIEEQDAEVKIYARMKTHRNKPKPIPFNRPNPDQTNNDHLLMKANEKEKKVHH